VKKDVVSGNRKGAVKGDLIVYYEQEMGINLESRSP
jgi:hypothetical protein